MATTRWLATLVLMVVSARCQEVKLVFTVDLAGHYVPFNESGVDCKPETQTISILPGIMELSSNEDDDAMDAKPLTPHWPQNCTGGLGRQKTQIEKLMNSTNTSAVTAGNLLGSGRWELPIQYQAAVEAARMYDVMGLAISDFRRGARFLLDYLSAINTTAHTVNVVACNVESTTLGNLVQPSAVSHGTAFVGFVDYDTDEETMFLDPEIQLNNLSCVQSEVLKLKSLNEDRPVVIMGCTSSVARLNNLTGGILNNTNVTAAVLSCLPDSEKEIINSSTAQALVPLLVTKGNGETVGFWSTSNFVNKTELNSTVEADINTFSSITSLQHQVEDFYTGSVRSYFNFTPVSCSSEECAVGDIITDAILVQMVVSEGLPIPESFRPMAVWPGHNITDGIRSGELTVEEVRDSLPDVQVALVGATGAGVTALFARAVSDLTKDGQATQAFLQVAGVRVIYDLDLPAPFRPKYLMNLCLTCPEQRYMAISPEWNYTIAVPATLLKDSAWADVTSQFFDIRVTDFTARDAVALMVNRTGRLLAPVGDRIRFTHINPDAEGGGDTFVTVLVTIVICMIVFGLAIFGFIAWSRRYSRHGSSIGLVR